MTAKEKNKRICAYEECGAEFEPARKWQIFCITKCRNAHHNKKNKGVEGGACSVERNKIDKEG